MNHNPSIKKIVRSAVESLPMSFFTTIVKRNFLSINYHIVSDQEPLHIKNLYPHKNIEMFERDLVFLIKRFNLIDYKQLSDHILHGTSLKPNSLAITFDDGFSECYSNVRPLLLKHHIPCIFFVITDYLDNKGMAADLKASLCLEKFKEVIATSNLNQTIDLIDTTFSINITDPDQMGDWILNLAANDHSQIDLLCKVLSIDVEAYLKNQQPYLTIDEVKELHDDGFTIGSHSLGHESFQDLSKDKFEDNVRTSCLKVQSITNADQIPFAFPFNMDSIPRDFLVDIRNRNPFVGLFFGGNGVKKDHKLVVSRMSGDLPTAIRKNTSNLPIKIKRSYLETIINI